MRSHDQGTLGGQGAGQGCREPEGKPSWEDSAGNGRGLGRASICEEIPSSEFIQRTVQVEAKMPESRQGSQTQGEV